MFLSTIIVDNCMHSPLEQKLKAFRDISNKYDVFFVDLWGVIHNGVECYKDAIFTLEHLKKKNKIIILISNAPRPSETVKLFLEKLKLPNYLYDLLITSGDITKKYLNKYSTNKKIYHLGPEKDKDLFKDLKIIISNKEECDEVVCTGLFFAENETIEKYKDDLVFFKNTNKKFICANPDEVVVRGTKIEYCAGAIANKYKQMEGEVVFFGKPHSDIYYSALKKMNIFEKFKTNKIKAFSIGDNLKTDIYGANILKIESLLILNGIYKDFVTNNKVNFEELKKSTNINNLLINYYQENLLW
jgi:HAD superfamily hydrolase (TIGR01459 family)